MSGVIQVPNAHFEGGMDDGGPEWLTVDQACKNEQIEFIKVLA
jgi:hypothetical protein